jgi:drebrin-like protein
MVDELGEGKVQYAFIRFKVSEGFKHVFVAWCGEGVTGMLRGNFANHATDFENFLTQNQLGFHVRINARSENDLKEVDIVKKINAAKGANFVKAATKAEGTGPDLKQVSKGFWDKQGQVDQQHSAAMAAQEKAKNDRLEQSKQEEAARLKARAEQELGRRDAARDAEHQAHQRSEAEKAKLFEAHRSKELQRVNQNQEASRPVYAREQQQQQQQQQAPPARAAGNVGAARAAFSGAGAGAPPPSRGGAPPPGRGAPPPGRAAAPPAAAPKPVAAPKPAPVPEPEPEPVAQEESWGGGGGGGDDAGDGGYGQPAEDAGWGGDAGGGDAGGGGYGQPAEDAGQPADDGAWGGGGDAGGGYSSEPPAQDAGGWGGDEQQAGYSTGAGDGGGGLGTCTALYDFAGENEGDLPFREGDVITILNCDDAEGWWQGELNGVVGYFASNFCQRN